jgi:hypothetical protein
MERSRRLAGTLCGDEAPMERSRRLAETLCGDEALMERSRRLAGTLCGGGALYPIFRGFRYIGEQCFPVTRKPLPPSPAGEATPRTPEVRGLRRQHGQSLEVHPRAIEMPAGLSRAVPRCPSAGWHPLFVKFAALIIQQVIGRRTGRLRARARLLAGCRSGTGRSGRAYQRASQAASAGCCRPGSAWPAD